MHKDLIQLEKQIISAIAEAMLVCKQGGWTKERMIQETNKSHENGDIDDRARDLMMGFIEDLYYSEEKQQDEPV